MPNWDNQAIAGKLLELADLLEQQNANPFRVYAYRRAALQRFVSLPPSVLEQREKLEQLRALAHGMTILLARVSTVPLGVDTIEELDRARRMLAPSPRLKPT